MCNLKDGGGSRLLAAILGLGVFAAGPLLAAPDSPIPGSQTAPPNYLWNSTDQYPLLAIRSVTVNGRTLSLTANQSLRLPAHPDITSFNFGPNELASNSPLRFRCQLDGYEQEWHERLAVMRMIIRFSDASERNIAEKSFDVWGESPGWNGSFSDSPWVRRREVIPVPADAVRFWVVISSAGPPEAVGVFAVRNLVVFTSESDTNGIRMIPPVTPDATKAEVEAAKVSPVGWERGGLRPTDGRLLRYGPDSEVALAILDDNPQGHADWSTALTRGPKVTPGEKLTIKWEEAYSIGAANYGQADYVQLPAGLYRFRMEALDLMGVPTGRGVSRLVTVPVAFWKTIWFWMTAGLALFGLAVGGWRLVESRKMKRQVQLIERQRALEQERTRIAKDIHDDLGASLTRISLLSQPSRFDPDDQETTAASLAQIHQTARDLTHAMGEVVWAVNPEHDTFDSLANYISNYAQNFLRVAGIRCRLEIPVQLPQQPLSSGTRHNLLLAFKEALNNAAKHSAASEVRIALNPNGDGFELVVADNGKGFACNGEAPRALEPQASRAAPGNGLLNMRSRLREIGGDCHLKSEPGAGTVITFCVTLKADHGQR